MKISGFKIIFLFLLGSCIAVLSSCFPIQTTTNTNRPVSGPVYNPFIQQLHPEFYIFHSGMERTRLYIKLNLAELLFAPLGPNKSNLARIKIEYRIFPFDNSENLADSSSTIFEIKKRKGETSAISYISISDKGLHKYYLQIITRDLLKQTRSEEFRLVNKDQKGNSQSFMVNFKWMNYPYFSRFFNADDTFRIQYSLTAEKLYVRYFGSKLPLPAPPYSTMVRGELYSFADSSWIVDGKNEFEFTQKKTGMYYFQTDTTYKSGLGMFNFGNNFPFIKSSQSLLEPIEYLASTMEFNQLSNSTNKKLAIDKFWLECGKNNNRARELIRIYYNRAFYANVYFSSFNEGWRTDRGMIYMIFGPPKTVKKQAGKEIWQYADKMNSKVLQFVFNQYENPYAENDYVLERNYDFQQFWSQAINSWRQGKVYTLFE